MRSKTLISLIPVKEDKRLIQVKVPLSLWNSVNKIRLTKGWSWTAFIITAMSKIIEENKGVRK